MSRQMYPVRYLSSLLIACLTCTCLFVGCEQPSVKDVGAIDPAKKTVFVDSYPLSFMVRNVCGDKFNIVFPVPEGTNPADWKPTADELAKFQKADLILLNGAGLSPWVQSASLPEAKTVDTSAVYQSELISVEGMTHSHGPGGEHTHGELAPMTWLDLMLARQQLKAVVDEVSKLEPEQADFFFNKGESLVHQIDNYHQALESVTSKFGDRVIIASHPVYQYLAKRYKLKIESLHWESGDSPTAEQIEELKKLQASSGAKFMIWEEEPSADAKAAAESAGLTSLVLATGAAQPAEGDWLDLLKQHVEVLRQISSPPTDTE